MVKKLEIKCSKEDFENLFQFLLKSSFKNIKVSWKRKWKVK